jgi:hypothetical protein
MRALIVCLALALMACGQEKSASGAGDQRTESVAEYGGGAGGADMALREMAVAPEQGVAAMDAAAPPAPPPPPPAPSPAPQQQQRQGPAPIAYLAYSYAVGVEVPGPRLTGLMDAHMQACVAAGPRLCQLIGSERSGDPEAYITGSLNIRGEPAWLRGFMDRLDGQTREAGGRVRSRSTTTEDLTRAIVDTEANQRAKRALRDRLQRLLESRPGRLSDLLEVERELARVQSEIDATESNLAVMRTRVDMSELRISYESAPRSVASDTLEPLGDAVASFVGIVVKGAAAIITLTAIILPFALVIWAIAWLLLWVRRRRGGRLINLERAPPPDRPKNAEI